MRATFRKVKKSNSAGSSRSPSSLLCYCVEVSTRLRTVTQVCLFGLCCTTGQKYLLSAELFVKSFFNPYSKISSIRSHRKREIVALDFVDAKRMPRGSEFGLDRRLSDKIEAKSKGSGLIRLRDEAADAIARLENLENHPNP